MIFYILLFVLAVMVATVAVANCWSIGEIKFLQFRDKSFQAAMRLLFVLSCVMIAVVSCFAPTTDIFMEGTPKLVQILATGVVLLVMTVIYAYIVFGFCKFLTLIRWKTFKSLLNWIFDD